MEDMHWMKAKADKKLKHFKQSKHEEDIYKKHQPIQVSPSTAFDLEDWDTHQELADFEYFDD